MHKRLFVAVKITPTSSIITLQKNLKSILQEDKIKWVDFANLHLTLKFLGDTNIELLPNIFASIENMAKQYHHFKINIKGIDRFSRRKRTKVIWLGIKDPACQLAEIAIYLEKHLSFLGLENMKKRFIPHLTIGRVKHIQNEQSLNTIINSYSDVEFQEFIVDHIILYESILKSNGPEYINLKKVALGSQLIYN